MKLLQHFTTDQVTLSSKDRLISILSCFISVFIVALITQALAPSPTYPIIVASMGASAIILFIIPSSPLAQPWPFVGGQLFSALIGISCSSIFPETSIAAAIAVGGSILVMLLLRCLHPPGAATALAPIMAGDSIGSLGFSFILTPVAINVAIMFFMALLINRWIMHREYPIEPQPTIDDNDKKTGSAAHVGISEQDLKHALANLDTFVDVTHSQLSKLLTQAELHSFKRLRGNITCADIMMRNVITADYGMEVEDAWKTMHNQKLKAMPVIDKARRVIGIVTWNDFFKFISLTAYDSFQEKFRSFIRRTQGPNTSKPEAVGHIMSPSVIVLSEDTHIVELIPLMSTSGHRQIPIINEERRLVGMVSQANLIAAIYNQELARQHS